MSVDEFIALVGNQFFTVCFVKRGNGEERVLNGRLRVKKHLAGGEKAYNFSSRDLVSVFDMQAARRLGGRKAYRAVPMEGLLWVKAGGRYIEVQQAA